MKNLIAIISGLAFGIGLALSGMTDTTKVQGFLDVFGQWDGSLLLVMAAALGTTFIAFHYLLKRQEPVIADKFFLPVKKVIDKPLIMGAVIFGVGWGMVGYCPGPAFAALGYFQWQALLFVVMMLLGSGIAKKLKV